MKLLILSLLIFSPAAFAINSEPTQLPPLTAKQIKERTTLEKETSCVNRPNDRIPWNYCIYLYPNHSNNVLYYFHGINGSRYSWKNENFEKNIVKRWVEKREQPPIVVSISFGAQWLLVEKNSSRKSGLYEIFVNEMMPIVQSRFRVQLGENWLMGVSMGGFNASQLYFKNSTMFTRAALICGAMTTVSPFASKQEVEEYKRRTGASNLLVGISTDISKSFMPTPADWQKHSPIILAMNQFSPLSIPLYVSNGTGDAFGFDEGNKVFTYLATERGAPVESHFYPGNDHCEVDPTPIADFFMRKPELLPEAPVAVVEDAQTPGPR